MREYRETIPILAGQPKVARAPASNRDVLVRAAVSALIATNVVLSLAVFVYVMSKSGSVPLRFATFAWLALAGFLAWYWMAELRWIRMIIWEAEVRTGLDLDHDGKIGKPNLAVIGARAGQAAAQRDAELAMLNNLATFVAGCAATGDTTEQAWVPRLDRETYVAFRDALIAGGFAHWRHGGRHNGGWALYPQQTAHDIIGAMLNDRPALLEQLKSELVS